MVLVDPVNLRYKERLDDLEIKIEEIRAELKIDTNIDAKIAELRQKIKEADKDESFFRWIKNKGLIKGCTVSDKLEEMETDAGAHKDKDNFKKLNKNSEYCKLTSKRQILREHAWIGGKYQELALKERQKLLRKIQLLEYRKLQLSRNKYCVNTISH